MLTRQIMDDNAINRALTRIAHEIIENNRSAENIALIGIQRRGVPLAERIANKIEEIEGIRPQLGILDITLYRDDLSMLAEHPIINGSDLIFSVDGMKLVMVDDVLYTGRTVRSGIEALLDLGRPAMIQFATLIDRGHRELPIRADYVGKNVPTSHTENICVKVKEIDGIDEVLLEKRGE